MKDETTVTRKKIDYLYNKLDEICDGDLKRRIIGVVSMKEIDKRRMKLLNRTKTSLQGDRR